MAATATPRAAPYVAITDMTTARTLLTVQGPRSRELLVAAHDRRPVERGVPLPDRAGDRGRTTARRSPLRVTYLGELGWELHIPNDVALTVYDALFEAGARPGPARRRAQALNSLRLEKAYRDYGARHLQRRHADRRRAGLHRRLGQAGRVHRARGAREAARHRRPHLADGPGARRRSGAAAVRGRAALPRRRARRREPRSAPTATRWAAASGSAMIEREEDVTDELHRHGHVGARHRRHAATR